MMQFEVLKGYPDDDPCPHVWMGVSAESLTIDGFSFMP